MLNMVISLALALSVQAKPFANHFIEMNIPDDWNCAPYMGEQWTCTPMDPEKQKDAVVVFSFAEQGAEDSLNGFYDYLKSEIYIEDPNTKKKEKVLPKSLQYKDIQGQSWVDALYLGQAIPDYYSRYLGTIKDGRSVLVSTTVDKAQYNAYMASLYKMIESIRLRVASPYEPTQTGLTGILGDKIKEIEKDKKKTIITPTVEQKSKTVGLLIAGLLGLVVFIFVYRYLRRKKQVQKIKKGGFLRK